MHRPRCFGRWPKARHSPSHQPCSRPAFPLPKKLPRQTERHQANDQREQDGHGTRQHHFFQRRLGGNVHALALRRACALQDSRNFLELAADFLHHFHGGLADAVHGQGREHHRNHATDEQRREDVGLEDVDAFNPREFDVRGKQGQGRQSCRGDGEALANRGRRVAHRVEDVSALTHFLWKFAHLRDATCVVRDRTEGVNGELHGRGGHHGASGDRHPVEAGKLVGRVNRGSEEDDGAKRRDHARRETGDDVRRSTR